MGRAREWAVMCRVRVQRALERAPIAIVRWAPMPARLWQHFERAAHWLAAEAPSLQA